MNEDIFKDIEQLVKKKVIMSKYGISSNEYKEYYATFLKRKQEHKDRVAYAIAKPMNDMLNFTNEAIKELLDLDGIEGVYLLYEGDVITYVGVSTNLKNRIPTSIEDKVSVDGFSYICTDSLSDAYILEVLLINTIKPHWNSATVGTGEISFLIPDKYDYKDLEIFR